MHVQVLQHVPFEGVGSMADWFQARGATLHYTRFYEADARLPDPASCDLIVAMGGPMSVNDPLAWIADEVAALQRFIERDIPIIGHCLGGQLLAKALGATIRRMPYTEVGWQSIQRRSETADSPWLAHLPEACSIFQWHGDTFALPDGAQPLLCSRWCDNQAFAWGDKVLALQGHPEMTEALIELWLDDWAHLLDASQPSQQSIAEMREGLSERVRLLNQVAEGFYAHWLKLAGL